MTPDTIARQRLVAQHLVGPRFSSPADGIRWFGAVQSQDYPAATWAIGQRLGKATAATIDDALADGTILRTHVLRPTWHFVVPNDIRWLLALTGPRVRKAIASYERQYGLDSSIIARAESVIATTLRDGQRLTRAELIAVLQQAGFALANTHAYGHIILCAELDALICNGGLRGKQHTYISLDARVPAGPRIGREEALIELTRRYVTSHGPATITDFAWWSGLTMADARHGLAELTQELEQIDIDGQVYWRAPLVMTDESASPVVHLLPNYDELLVAYKDRQAAIDPQIAASVDHWTGNVLFSHTIVKDGRVIGTWKRTLTRDSAIIAPRLFTELNDCERTALSIATDHYGTFLDRQAYLSW